MPGRFGQFLNHREGLSGKHPAILRGQYEQYVVVLGVGVLQLFEGAQLRICLAKEHPIVVAEDQPLGTTAQQCGNQ